MIDTYVKILADTHVTGYPYVVAAAHPHPGSEDAPVGVRVDETKLIAMNAYLASLQAPRGANVDPAAYARGKAAFVSTGCTNCHNANQARACANDDPRNGGHLAGRQTSHAGDARAAAQPGG